MSEMNEWNVRMGALHWAGRDEEQVWQSDLQSADMAAPNLKLQDASFGRSQDTPVWLCHNCSPFCACVVRQVMSVGCCPVGRFSNRDARLTFQCLCWRILAKFSNSTWISTVPFRPQVQSQVTGNPELLCTKSSQSQGYHEHTTKQGAYLLSLNTMLILIFLPLVAGQFCVSRSHMAISTLIGQILIIYEPWTCHEL